MLVLTVFDKHEHNRCQFLSDWLEAAHLSRLNLVTRSFVIGVALEQLHLVPEARRNYVRQWHLRHDDLSSIRARAWQPYYLELSGASEEANKRAGAVLDLRERDGSWASDFDRTVGCAYALLRFFRRTTELDRTLGYIARRLAGGFARRSVVLDAQIIKLFDRAGLFPQKTKQRIARQLESRGTVFLSHNASDKEFVRRLAVDLANDGFEPWLDEAEILPGDSIVEKVNDGLKGAEFLVAVLSPHSVASAWVKRELNSTLMTQLSGKHIVLLPVLLKDCDIPPLLQDVVWADFRGDYAAGYEQLARSINRPRKDRYAQ